jgi:hypothetical protein
MLENIFKVEQKISFSPGGLETEICALAVAKLWKYPKFKEINSWNFLILLRGAVICLRLCQSSVCRMYRNGTKSSVLNNSIADSCCSFAGGAAG